MPVKKSNTALIAVGLVSFAAGMLLSRRKCRSCSTPTNVRRWGKLYLSVNPPEEFNDKNALDAEVKKITAQVQENHIDKAGYHGRYRLGYTIERIVVEGKNLLEVQYYTVKIDAGNFNKSFSERDSSKEGQSQQGIPKMMSAETLSDDTGHTPPQCPRPRPNYFSKYSFEGWTCDYN
jgi:hypothetical protein